MVKEAEKHPETPVSEWHLMIDTDGEIEIGFKNVKEVRSGCSELLYNGKNGINVSLREMHC
jgi:hypothetical protein